MNVRVGAQHRRWWRDGVWHACAAKATFYLFSLRINVNLLVFWGQRLSL